MKRTIALVGTVLVSLAVATAPAWAADVDPNAEETTTAAAPDETPEQAEEGKAPEETEAPETTEPAPEVTETEEPAAEPEKKAETVTPVAPLVIAADPVERQPVKVDASKACGVVTLTFTNPMDTVHGFRWNAVAGNTSTGDGARTGLVEVGAKATEKENIKFAEDEFGGTAAVTVSVAFGPDSDIQPRLDIYPVDTDCGAEPVITDPEPEHVFFRSCRAVRAADALPLLRGEDGYRRGLDRDRDGVACEREDFDRDHEDRDHDGRDRDHDDDSDGGDSDGGDSDSSDDGDDGSDGQDGADGADGQDGTTTVVTTSDNSNSGNIPVPVGGVATGVGPAK